LPFCRQHLQLPVMQPYLPFLSCPSCSLPFLSSAAHRVVVPSFPQLPIVQSSLPFLNCPSCSLPSFPQLPIVQSSLPFLSCPSCSLPFLSSATHRAVFPSFPQLPICCTCNVLMCFSQSSGASTEFAGGLNSPHLWKAPSVWWCGSAAQILFASVWIIAMVDPESLPLL